MNTEANKVKSIFLEAVEKCDTENWDTYLDEACGDDNEVRRRVKVLLQAHVGDDRLFDIPESDNKTVDQLITESPGSVIGPYKLLQSIGEGGMGVVFLAEQKQPVERRVALKIIKPGMDTRQVIARFEAEEQALAMMDHPNIAKVLDAGTTDSGRPYFVMELVNGIPVTQYCDEQHLTTRERLELFIPICQAVQHAHQKGIIHRDIKPSNILIALYDGRPVPKVIDFGVAKATGGNLTDNTLFTALGQIVGTLEYMSPEQAQRNQLDIDTRSDIYSLGVVLYELLAGDTPFDKQRLRSAALDELLRIIREEEPPKPSTRVSSSQSLPEVADNRHTEPKKLSALMRGELDWIVMKALEKDRSRRYETASSFAADVAHYLNDEPVLACPPSARYRFGKFARRNKGRLVTASLLAAALLVAVGGVGWAVRDREAQRTEVAREKIERQQRVTTQVELLLADVDRLIQEQEWDDALVTVQRAEVAIAGGEANAAVKEKVQTALSKLKIVASVNDALQEQCRLDEAIYKYRKVIELYPNHADARHLLGLALAKQGNLKQAISENRTAFEYDANDLFACTNLVWYLTTAEDPALRNPPEAVTLARYATEMVPEHPNHWCNLGVAEYRVGNWQESVDAFRQADVLIGGDGDRQHRFFLAMAHWQLGNQAEAREAFEQAINWLDENNINDGEQMRFRDEAESLLNNSPTAEKDKSDD